MLNNIIKMIINLTYTIKFINFTTHDKSFFDTN